MKSYIFATPEGYTYQPQSDSSLPDVENLQVIGFAVGENERDALQNLLEEESWILDSSFDSLICYELKHLNYDSRAMRLEIR